MTETVERSLVDHYFRLYPAEVAAALERRPAEEVAAVMESEPEEAAAPVFEAMTPATGEVVLECLATEAAARLLGALEAARAAALLARLEAARREEILSRLPASAARDLRDLMSYPADRAGALMDPQVAAFRAEARVEDAVERLRGLRRKRIQDVFLVDSEGRLTGSVAVQDLIAAAPSDRLEGLARGTPAAVQATATREEVVGELTERKLSSLPVVDFDGRLVGVIRQPGLVAAVADEATADLQTMVGASKEERALSKVSFAVGKRLPWLQINLLTAFLAASVVGLFEDTIARNTALAVLLPVVAGQSGNTGAQALAVTMRGLAMREIRTAQWFRVSFKEVQVAAINGVGVALTTSIGVLVWSGSAGLALVIGVSMILSMIAAGLSGAAIPMVLTAVGQDPAQSSSIILTTVTDVVGFFSFLGIATALAGML